MSEFIDLYLDDLIAGFPCYSSPRFSTTIQAAASGAEHRNRNWAHPLRRFKLPEAIREHPQYEAIQDHWLVMGGPEASFPFRDPLDFASVPLVLPNVPPAISLTDQSFGTGDGSAFAFPLTKTYSRGGATYTRPVYLPVVDEVLIGMNGLAPSAVSGALDGPYTVLDISRPGGIVTFDKPVHAGIALTWGGYFDCRVRFEADDSFDGIVQSYQVSGFADLTFLELRPC
jgi:uncharacterized protein (TIGR02217 family)